ncbi:MAG: GtrA family protein [Acidobacteriota bacterium]
MSTCKKSPSCLKRWLVFNSVGAMGILVQIFTLTLLVSTCGLHYLPATFLAVEAAILHNFCWHERWTWADRQSNCRNSRLARLLYFHLANGVISLTGNLLLMSLFVEHLSMHYLTANGLCVAICSVVNFIAGDRFVFRSNQIQTDSADLDMHSRHRRYTAPVLVLFAGLLFCPIQPVLSAELKSETIEAWDNYIKVTEKRIERELMSDKGFLVMDFQDKDKVTHQRNKLLDGDIIIEAMESKNNGRKVKVPDGRIHHWRGGIFIPGVDLDFVFSGVEDPESEDMAQEDVLESRVLERSTGGLKLFLKLQRSKIVTVIYNTEHDIHFKRHSAFRASSSSVATKIAEVERLEANNEREKPEGNDHGFLWRMNSYWRYEQIQGGVIVECESVTLSRNVPVFLKIMISPMINRVAKESMERTLQSMRTRMTRTIEWVDADTTSVASVHPVEKD